MNIFEHTTDLEILDLSYNPLKVIDKHTTIAIDNLPMLKVSKHSLLNYLVIVHSHNVLLGATFRIHSNNDSP